MKQVPMMLARIAVAVVLGLLAASSEVGAQQQPYTDDDSGYLKVIDTFAYPVGVLLEWTIFRPLHMLETRGVQGMSQGRVENVGSVRVLRGCHSERPPRYCTDPRYAQ
jgi:hypothetical protein